MCSFLVRLHKMKIHNYTRCAVTFDVNSNLHTVQRPSNFVIAAPKPVSENEKRKKTAGKRAKPKKVRKKTIKVYGRYVRRPKRRLRPSQIRTVDLVDEPIKMPIAVAIKQENGENLSKI